MKILLFLLIWIMIGDGVFVFGGLFVFGGGCMLIFFLLRNVVVMMKKIRRMKMMLSIGVMFIFV